MKAIALFSGGLDSTLAMKLIIDQGIEVLALNISTGFGSTKDRYEHMKGMCEQVGAELKIIDIESEFLQDVLFDPKHGYGKNFNPCIDCHAKMFAVAKRIMKKEGASFLISGEVMGQRPMSQNSDAMQTVLNESNCDGLLLRPLSALCLSPTLAEENGWVDRDKLEGITGRSRDRQLALATEIELADFESPGGGCLLTDKNFSKKMFDFIKYDKFEVQDIPVMKYGRHFRLSDGAKLVVGRNQEENRHLKEIKNDKFCHLKVLGVPGPHALFSKNATQKDKNIAIQAVLLYCKTSVQNNYIVDYDGEEVTGSPFSSREAMKPFTIL